MTDHEEVIKEFREKFNEVLHRMYNLEIVPEIQSRINERIPERGGFMLFQNEELESFLLFALKKNEEAVRKETWNKAMYRFISVKKKK